MVGRAAKARAETRLMRRRVEQAWRFRWGSILARSATRAVAMSLLELSGVRGVDGECPRTQEVESDCLHAGLAQ